MAGRNFFAFTLALAYLCGPIPDARAQCGSQPGEVTQAPPPPPGTEKVVSYDRAGDVVAACALKSGPAVSQGGRTVPPTEVWITNGRDVWKTATGLGTCDPDWSPDGTRLLVAAPDGIWILSGQAQQQGERFTDVRVAEEAAPAGGVLGFSLPRWSPDGRRIATVVHAGGRSWVEVMDAQTGKRLFKSHTEANDYAWGPDSESLTIAGEKVPVAR
jgi:dipeptidyl aminopeptidase/acylaminoacyl peptidase